MYKIGIFAIGRFIVHTDFPLIFTANQLKTIPRLIGPRRVGPSRVQDMVI